MSYPNGKLEIDENENDLPKYLKSSPKQPQGAALVSLKKWGINDGEIVCSMFSSLMNHWIPFGSMNEDSDVPTIEEAHNFW